jgi:hypothetical protein
MVSTDLDVWKQIVDDLGYFTDVGTDASRTETDARSAGGNVELELDFRDLACGCRISERVGDVIAVAGKSRAVGGEPGGL